MAGRWNNSYDKVEVKVRSLSRRNSRLLFWERGEASRNRIQVYALYYDICIEFISMFRGTDYFVWFDTDNLRITIDGKWIIGALNKKSDTYITLDSPKTHINRENYQNYLRYIQHTYLNKENNDKIYR